MFRFIFLRYFRGIDRRRIFAGRSFTKSHAFSVQRFIILDSRGGARIRIDG